MCAFSCYNSFLNETTFLFLNPCLALDFLPSKWPQMFGASQIKVIIISSGTFFLRRWLSRYEGLIHPGDVQLPAKAAFSTKKNFCKINLHFLLENGEVFPVDFFTSQPCPSSTARLSYPTCTWPCSFTCSSLWTHKIPLESSRESFPGEIQRTPLGSSAPKPSLSSHTEMKEFLATLHIKLEQVLSIKKILNLARIYFSSSLSGH